MNVDARLLLFGAITNRIAVARLVEFSVRNEAGSVVYDNCDWLLPMLMNGQVRKSRMSVPLVHEQAGRLHHIEKAREERLDL